MANPMPSSGTARPDLANQQTTSISPPPPEATRPPPVITAVLQSCANLPTLPGYVVLEEIARGGMGMVLRARDVRLDRELAVKVLLDKCRDRPETFSRFLAEAHLLGRLQHPGIVPIHELGHDATGQPFFVMKLVRGETLAKLLEADNPVGQAARLPRFLKIFEQICQAVGYAHHEGIIHRDLKPLNIMVGAFGEVQVMDWGLAKSGVRDQRSGIREGRSDSSVRAPNLTNDSHTQAGAVFGTPAYMSPEQARGDIEQIDARTDVFALGAMLCEILTGKPPYTRPSAIDQICDAQDAVLTDAFVRLDQCGVDVELVNLAKRCMAAKPMDRPADGAEVAAAISEYLSQVQERLRQAELVKAKAEAKTAEEAKTLAEAQAKLQAERRARWLLLGLAAALLIGVVGASVLAYVAEGQRQRAETNETTALQKQKEAEIERERATLEEKKATEAGKNMGSMWSFFQEHVLAAGRPKGQEGGLGKDLKLREAIDAAEPYIGKEFADKPVIEAAVRETMGTTYWQLGEPVIAIRQHERALSLRRELQGGEADETLRSLNQLGLAYGTVGRNADALRVFTEIYEVAKKREHPGSRKMLHAMGNLAMAYRAVGRTAEAAPLLEEVLKGERELLGPNHKSTLDTLGNLALVYHNVGRIADALPLMEECTRLTEAKLGPNHPDTLVCLDNLGSMYRDAGRLAEAIPLLEEAVKRAKAELGDGHPDTLACMNNLAKAYRAAGRAADAIPLLQPTLKGCRSKFGPGHPNTVGVLLALADSYSVVGRWPDAADLYEELLDFHRQKKPPDDIALSNTMVSLANCRLKQEQFSKVETLLREALQIREKSLSPGHWAVPNTKSLLGASLTGQKKYAEAEPLLVQGYEGLAQAKNVPAGRLSEAVERLVQLYTAWGKTDEAAKWKKKLTGSGIPTSGIW